MSMTRRIQSIISLLLLSFHPITPKSIELIDKSGKLAPNRDLIGLATRTGDESVIIASVGLSHLRKDQFLNSAFGTNFKVDESLVKDHDCPACVDGTPGVILINCNGVMSDNEAKTTALSAEVANVIIVNILRSDLGRNLPENAKTLKSVFSQKLENFSKDMAAAAKVPLIVLVHDCEDDIEQSFVTENANEILKSAWDESLTDYSLSDLFEVTIKPVPHPKYNAKKYAEFGPIVRDLACGNQMRTETSKFAPIIKSAWASTLGKAVPMISDEGREVYFIEGAYTEAVNELEGTLSTWRMASNRGKMIGGYGKRADRMYASLLEEFDRKTIRFAGNPLRSERRRGLVGMMEKEFADAFRRQVAIASSASLKRFKRKMNGLLNAEKLNEENVSSLLRKTIFEFESKATEMVLENISDLSFEAEYEELEGELYDFEEKFGESPAAQSLALSKVERQVMKGASDLDKPGKKRRRGKQSVTAGLGLVAFVRRPGLGNLQAFGGYRQGPHTVTFGYANDASTPEAMQDGEAPPLLRLQPKLNLDIDL